MKAYEAVDSLSQKIGCDNDYISRVNSFNRSYNLILNRKAMGTRPSEDDLMEIKKLYNGLTGKSGKVSIDIEKNVLQNIGISEKNVKDLLDFERVFKNHITTQLVEDISDENAVEKVKNAFERIQKKSRIKLVKQPEKQVDKPETSLAGHFSLKNLVSKLVHSLHI